MTHKIYALIGSRELVNQILKKLPYTKICRHDIELSDIKSNFKEFSENKSPIIITDVKYNCDANLLRQHGVTVIAVGPLNDPKYFEDNIDIDIDLDNIDDILESINLILTK